MKVCCLQTILFKNYKCYAINSFHIYMKRNAASSVLSKAFLIEFMD